MIGILGEKVGMTAVFNADGAQVPVTVIRTAGTVVLGKRTEERDGYTALILGFGEKRTKRVAKAQLGTFEKLGLVEERNNRKYVKRHVREFRVPADVLDKYEIGAPLEVGSLFKAGDTVDVVGTSKGRGFTGVMKRHNFAGFKASHGVHEYFRHGGSISANTYPAHVFKNKKMPGQHGNARVTVLNLKVVDVLPEQGLLLVRGGIPGPNKGLVAVRRAIKKG